MKAKPLLKLHLGQTPAVPVMPGNEREKKSTHLPTPRRAVLAITRHEMQAIRAIGQPEGNVLVAWPQVLYRRV